MTGFDFLYDPRTLVLERIRAFKISRQLGTAVIAFATAAVVVISGWAVERSRAVTAEGEVGRLGATDVALHQRLAAEKLEAAEVADLGALDGRLRAIAGSGLRFRTRMVALAEDVPRDSWLTSVTDDGKRVTLVGRALNLGSVARAMSQIAGGRLGAPALDRIARVERPGRSLLEFALSLGGR